jgi:2'-5' RNA ligase
MKGVGFSLWLVPEGEARRELAGMIARLARSLGTPAFQPHVTLLGGIEGTARGVTAAAGSLAARIPCLTVRLSGTGMRREYFRCLYLEVAPSRALLRARRLAEAAFGRVGSGAFEPHVSLAYGGVPKSKKQAAFSPPAGAVVPAFEVLSLDVVRTAGPVADWTLVARFALGRDRHRA